MMDRKSSPRKYPEGVKDQGREGCVGGEIQE